MSPWALAIVGVSTGASKGMAAGKHKGRLKAKRRQQLSAKKRDDRAVSSLTKAASRFYQSAANV